MIEMGIRGFQEVKKKFLRTGKGNGKIYFPQRATEKSAGYDFKSPIDVLIYPDSFVRIYTNIKAYMLDDEYLELNIRSSKAIKKNLRLKNSVGIIDCDYYSNFQNDGGIIICLFNEGHNIIKIKQGEKIVQAIFKKYLLTDDDEPVNTERIGGIGSTDN